MFQLQLFFCSIVTNGTALQLCRDTSLSQELHYCSQGLCGSIFCFLCHGWQTFSGVRVAQSLVFCVMVGRLLVGFVCLNLQFSVSWLVAIQTFSGVRVALSLFFCVMVGRLLVGFVWLNLLFSVSWQVDFQWSSCGSIFSFLWHGLQSIVCSVILFSSDNYVICHQIYGFCLPIWHLQIFPTNYMYIELEG